MRTHQNFLLERRAQRTRQQQPQQQPAGTHIPRCVHVRIQTNVDITRQYPSQYLFKTPPHTRHTLLTFFHQTNYDGNHNNTTTNSLLSWDSLGIGWWWWTPKKSSDVVTCTPCARLSIMYVDRGRSLSLSPARPTTSKCRNKNGPPITHRMTANWSEKLGLFVVDPPPSSTTPVRRLSTQSIKNNST